MTARTCHGHPLPCNAANNTCVSENDAASVFSIGDFEYKLRVSRVIDRLYTETIRHTVTSGTQLKTPRRTIRSHSVTHTHSAHPIQSDASPGVFFAELADALAAPTFTHRLAVYVGHDGTLVRLLAGLGVIPLRWPSFGSEVVLEVRHVVCARSGCLISPILMHRFGKLSAVNASYAYFTRAQYSLEWSGYDWTR